jgi:antitoxin VapB
MGEEYRARIFKSGNSLALRLPKALGLAEGEEVVLLSHEDGSISFWKEDQARQVFLALYGSMSADFMQDGRGDTEQADRDWTSGAPQAA